MWSEDPREFLEEMFARLSGVFIFSETPTVILDPQRRVEESRKLRGTQEQPKHCDVCGKKLAQKDRGRYRIYCAGNKCRLKAYRERRRR